MESDGGAVYNATTEPQAKPPRRPFGCTLRHLRVWQLPTKALQTLINKKLNIDLHKSYIGLHLILSLLAFICEEMVENCINCAGLYFFEFISSSAFLWSLLVLCVYCTNLYKTFEEDKIQTANFWAMPAIGVCFLLASIVLAATSSGTAVEKAACAFGFLASGAFLAEVIESFYSQKQKVDRSSENPGNTPNVTENQPLNKQS